MVLLCLMAFAVNACRESQHDIVKPLLADGLAKMKAGGYRLDIAEINAQIAEIAEADRDTLPADRFVRSYYSDGNPLLWVMHLDDSSEADTLLSRLKRVGEIGFSQSAFFVEQIEESLRQIREHAISDSTAVNAIVAELDYNLTKAYLRYLGGQRYGFVNPQRLLNRLVVDANDSMRKTFRHLFDIDIQSHSPDNYRQLISLIGKEDLSVVIRDAEKHSPLYDTLKARLPQAEGADRNCILVNMERCRWKRQTKSDNSKKRVEVNIPAFSLMAFDGDSLLQMRVVCGSRKTPTPMLDSHITRMDLNPKWIVPYSIVKNEIAPHAGDSAYFARNNYYITEKASSNRIDISLVTYGMLRSGKYRVIQEGGEGNSLGRIIFRFDNNFSVYLHDTPSKSTFQRADRSVSHGCVRVEKPYEFARFLLGADDEATLEKVKYSMTYVEEKEHGANTLDRKKIIRSAGVTPSVPVSITYYTLYLMPDGRLLKHPDVYGYDKAIAQGLKAFQ